VDVACTAQSFDWPTSCAVRMTRSDQYQSNVDYEGRSFAKWRPVHQVASDKPLSVIAGNTGVT